MKRFAAVLLERALGAGRAQSVLGDLEEDLTRGRRPWWASSAPGVWLFWQAIAYAAAARWAERGVTAGDVKTRASHASEPRARSGDHGVPARARVGGTAGAKPPGITLELITMWHDVRHAIRSLRSAPSFTVVALIVLSLGIGASTAIYSIVDAVVLRGLPYDEADRLVQVGTRDAKSGVYESFQSPQNFADWQARQSVFAAMTTTRSAGGFTVSENGAPKDLLALQATPGYFDVYRAHPQLGQVFTEQHQLVGSERVALISDGLWRRQFGADPKVIGQTLRSTAALTYGAPFPVPTGTWTIIGVMPRGFRAPVSGRQTDVWVPYVVPENQRTRDGSRSAPLQVTARLVDGVTVEEAEAQIKAITASLAQAYPAWFEKSVGAVRSLHEATVGDVRAWMLLLLGAVGVVLLITCINVASLMLARTVARGREVQTRVALGASRWQIARGLLIESMVLATGGAVLGLLVAVWGVDVLRAALPEPLPRVSDVALDLRVLGVTALVSIATGLLFGLAPALLFSRPVTANAPRGSSSVAAAGGTRLRSALVVSEIALAVVLTIGAGLFLSSFVRVANVDIGLDPDNVLTMQLWPKFDSSRPDWAEPALTRSTAAVPEIVDRVSAIPGVVAAGFIAGNLPLTGYSARSVVSVPGREQPFDGRDRADVRHVTPGYARAVGAHLRRGRYIEAGDTSGSTAVVVLNEEAVARYFPGRDPLGATIAIGRNAQPLTVVGVVDNVRLGGPESAVRPEAYLPAAQGRFLGGALAVRVTGDPHAVAGAVRGAIWASFPEISEPEATTMESLLGGFVAQRRFTMLIVGLFGGLALAIASAGLYGVMAYLVSHRTREIGVRLALGASPKQVMTAVIGRGAVHTAAGVAVGVTVAWQLGSFVQPFLFEVRSFDAVVYGASAALLTACGVTAAFVPARRAARVNPVIALRAE